MHSTSPCSACGLPFREDWVLLATTAGHCSNTPTHLCPRCTMGRTGTRPGCSLTTQYQARLVVDTLAGPRCRQLQAGERRSLATAGLEVRAGGPLVFDASAAFDDKVQDESAQERVERRLSRCVAEVDAIGRHRERTTGQPRSQLKIMQVGSGNGEFLLELRAQTDARCVGIEPLMPEPPSQWQGRLEIVCTTLEQLDGTGPHFDLIVETAVLEHLAHPRRHLEAIAHRLKPDGRALIEVANLCGTSEPLETGFLRRSRHNVFNARSLATMCAKAGLVVVQIYDEETLTIIVRPAHPCEKQSIPAGVSPKIIARSAWANNLRLTVKHGLEASGPTPEMMSLAAHAHANCNWAPGRADIALEIAVACEADDRLEVSAHWLRRSLDDRRDDEVEVMLREIEIIIRRCGRRRMTPLPMLAEGEELQAQPQLRVSVPHELLN